ncbi:hypothetical protein BVY01_04195 [bacterium I07]|nr:hypothetical protein BVY01_04195 [bacterium I07]
MPLPPPFQLISYIAPAAPARRTQSRGDLPWLRPEIGFTPKWFKPLNIDFGRRWHESPKYRRESVLRMRDFVQKQFSAYSVGLLTGDEEQPDLLTGVYGANFISSLYGVSQTYHTSGWPQSKPLNLTDTEIDALRPPVLNEHPLFQKLLKQIEWIMISEGKLLGYINWQGILNNAYRLRGEKLFLDLIDSPERCIHLFDCLFETMVEACSCILEIKGDNVPEKSFFTVSNCLINLVSPEIYENLLMPYDQKLATYFGCLGIHNCQWCADPYLEAYSQIDNVGYIDMGIESDLKRARSLFPVSRRALMLKQDFIKNEQNGNVENTLERVADEFGCCDLVLADLDSNHPDGSIDEFIDQIIRFLEMCSKISDEYKKISPGIASPGI